MSLLFEWDEVKARENFRKHGVTFDEARTVFGDPFSITISDPQHSRGEYRFVDLGRSATDEILIVAYTERKGKIRIINCRKAIKRERRIYEKGIGK